LENEIKEILQSGRSIHIYPTDSLTLEGREFGCTIVASSPTIRRDDWTVASGTSIEEVILDVVNEINK
jgi:hypothetical protein